MHIWELHVDFKKCQPYINRKSMHKKQLLYTQFTYFNPDDTSVKLVGIASCVRKDVAWSWHLRHWTKMQEREHKQNEM